MGIQGSNLGRTVRYWDYKEGAWWVFVPNVVKETYNDLDYNTGTKYYDLFDKNTNNWPCRAKTINGCFIHTPN